MNIHEFGCGHVRNLVLIHGACMSWDMFEKTIALLQESFHVYVPAIPGHDLTTAEEFTSLEAIAAELEEELIRRGAEEIELLYGLSMGGGFVIRMLADNRLRIRHAVIDAGIAPYELPRICTRFILARDVLMTALGKYSRAALESAFPRARYGSAADRMWQVLQHMTMRSIRNVYDSTDNYAMPDVFPDIETKIEYWYGAREKKERKPDIAYVRKHIPGVVFRELAGMGHGEYAAAHAEELADDLTAVAAGNRRKQL